MCPNAIFLRFNDSTEIQLSIAKSAEDLRPGFLHFYTPTFDIRKAGLGGQVCIVFEAYGFGSKCVSDRGILVMLNVRKLSLLKGNRHRIALPVVMRFERITPGWMSQNTLRIGTQSSERSARLVV